jgi:hypothetical protein
MFPYIIIIIKKINLISNFTFAKFILTVHDTFSAFAEFVSIVLKMFFMLAKLVSNITKAFSA